MDDQISVHEHITEEPGFPSLYIFTSINNENRYVATRLFQTKLWLGINHVVVKWSCNLLGVCVLTDFEGDFQLQLFYLRTSFVKVAFIQWAYKILTINFLQDWSDHVLEL